MKPEKTFPEDKIFEIKDVDLCVCSIGKEKRWMDCDFFKKTSGENIKIGRAENIILLQNEGKTRIYSPKEEDMYVWLHGKTCSWVKHSWGDTIEVYCQCDPMVKMRKPSDVREDEYLQGYLDQIDRAETDNEKRMILDKIYSDGFEDCAKEGWE